MAITTGKTNKQPKNEKPSSVVLGEVNDVEGSTNEKH